MLRGRAVNNMAGWVGIVSTCKIGGGCWLKHKFKELTGREPTQEIKAIHVLFPAKPEPFKTMSLSDFWEANTKKYLVGNHQDFLMAVQYKHSMEGEIGCLDGNPIASIVNSDIPSTSLSAGLRLKLTKTGGIMSFSGSNEEVIRQIIDAIT